MKQARQRRVSNPLQQFNTVTQRLAIATVVTGVLRLSATLHSSSKDVIHRSQATVVNCPVGPSKCYSGSDIAHQQTTIRFGPTGPNSRFVRTFDVRMTSMLLTRSAGRTLTPPTVRSNQSQAAASPLLHIITVNHRSVSS